MPEMVYRAGRHSGTGGRKLHTDPDCPRLKQANTIIGPKPRDRYGEDRGECAFCMGEVEPNGGDDSLYRKLVEMGENNA